MEKSKLQKGFTLTELLITVTIISILMAISTISLNCYMSATDVNELKKNSTLLTTAIDSYVIDRGEIPVGEAINPSNIDSDITKKLTGLFKDGDQTKVLKEGYIHTIDTKRMNNKRVNLTEEEINDFLIVSIPYIDTVNLSGQDLANAELQNTLANSYNGTLIVKSYVNSCSNKEFTYLKSRGAYQNDLQTSTNYDIPKSYINCPNGTLSENNNEVCSKVKK